MQYTHKTTTTSLETKRPTNSNTTNEPINEYDNICEQRKIDSERTPYSHSYSYFHIYTSGYLSVLS